MHRHDQAHAAAARTWAKISDGGRSIATTDLVMAETQTLLARRLDPSSGLEFARRLLARPERIIWNDVSTTARAMEWLERFADRPLSLTDAVSFAAMEARGIGEAFTFDRDFRDAGFRVAPASTAP